MVKKKNNISLPICILVIAGVYVAILFCSVLLNCFSEITW